MNMKEAMAFAGSLVLILGVFGTMWWQLAGQIHDEISQLETKLDAKIERTNALLTDNLLQFRQDMVRLQGASHTHNNPPRLPIPK